MFKAKWKEIKKIVENYEELTYSHSEKAKEDIEMHRERIENILNLMQGYIVQEQEKLTEYGRKNIELFSVENFSYICIIIMPIHQRILYYKMDKICKDLEKMEKYQFRVKAVHNRFMQFKYLT